MRIVDAGIISDVVSRLCVESNIKLSDDVSSAIKHAAENETSLIARSILEALVTNMQCAENTRLPLCQDTGMAIIFMEIGQDVHITGGELRQAVDEGVRRGYSQGHLRASVVADPLRRVNTGDNTPASLHVTVVPGENIDITVAPKGFGSENMCQLKMFTPTACISDIVAFVTEAVRQAGANPCPPVVIGVGLGGTADGALHASKRALMCRLDEHNEDQLYADMEQEILRSVNKLGIGPQGLGGDTTALGCRIITLPTHIAGLPCAVSIGCHVTRHASERI